MSGGWIKYWRKVQEDEEYLKYEFDVPRTWSDCLLMADADGNIVTTITILARRWKWERHRVTRRLKELEKLGRITISDAPKQTSILPTNSTPISIHIIKWKEFQGQTGERPFKRPFNTHLNDHLGENLPFNLKKEDIKEGEEARARATPPPTKEEILEFSKTNAQHVNVERFYEHYQKAGWPEDWQAKLKEWDAKDKAEGKPVVNSTSEADDYYRKKAKEYFEKYVTNKQ